MLKNKFSTLLLFCFLFLASHFMGKAQDTKVVSLITYIQQLEQRFQVKFSYIDKDMEEITITPLVSDNLDTIFNHITKNTTLQFKKLNNRYYTISKATVTDICATLLDNFEQNNINGATVEVLNTQINTVTDDEGKFIIKDIPLDAIIRIRFIGFKTMHLKAKEILKKDSCPTFVMDRHYEQLEEVVVSQFLTTGLSKKQDASIVLNTGDFGILPGLIEPDVLQTVQALPGIKSIDETVSDINVRGGTNDQNLVLWEGIKMYQSGHFFGLISAFNPYLTDKVTIIKNGTSAAYGDGVSSVLDMRTNNKANDDFFGGAGFNMISADIFGQIPITDKLAFQFSGRRSVTDFLSSPTYNRFFDRAFQDSSVENKSSNRNVTRNEDFYFYDFSAKILYDINENQKVRFSFINLNNTLDYTETTDDGSSSSSLNQRNISFGGGIESQWSNHFFSNINAHYTNYDMEAQSVSADANQQLNQNNEVVESGLKLNTNYQFSNNLQWTNGYQFNETGIINRTNVTQPPYNKNIKGVVRANSFYSELDFQNNKLNAKGGVRINHIKNLNTFTKWIVEPRINVNYTLFNNFKTEILGEFKSQYTNQIIDLEQNFLGIEKRRWVLANELNLPITTSKQGSIGLVYDNNSIYIGLEGFVKNVEGISTDTQGFQSEGQFNGEIGKYNVQGIEFLINKKASNYSTWLSYTYNTNNYTFKDIDPSTFPNNLDIRHNITFAGTYNYKKIKLGVGVHYRTGKPYTQPQEGNNVLNILVFPNTINYEEPNSSRLPEYIRADISANYSFNLGDKSRATVGGSILNLLDRKNILNTYYRVTPENEIETVESISLGITPNVSFRIQF